MLPPRLTEVRRNLELKGFRRTSTESDLLAELVFLDSSPEVEKHLNEGIRTGEVKRILGPAGNCPCCGR